MGFGGKTLNLIKSMYTNDSLRFVINGKYSREIFLSRGVKQGIHHPCAIAVPPIKIPD